MPGTESTQHKLDRVRPPRVQITYDVEIGDAIETICGNELGHRLPTPAINHLEIAISVELAPTLFG